MGRQGTAARSVLGGRPRGLTRKRVVADHGLFEDCAACQAAAMWAVVAGGVGRHSLAVWPTT